MRSASVLRIYLRGAGFHPGSGETKNGPEGRSKQLIFLRKSGAGEGIRTLDPNLGKVVLYP